MNASEQTDKLFAALAAAQADFKSVGKSGDNKFDKYQYAKLEDYVRVVKPVFAEHKLSVLTSVTDVESLPDRPTAGGKIEHAARVKIVQRIAHESGQWIETASVGEGQDRADKAVYKAITGARKYGLASALGLATSDDPEADENVGVDDKPKGKKAAAAVVDAGPPISGDLRVKKAQEFEKACEDQKIDPATRGIIFTAYRDKHSNNQSVQFWDDLIAKVKTESAVLKAWAERQKNPNPKPGEPGYAL